MKKIIVAAFLFLGVLMFPGFALATTFDLIAPSGELVRGQNVVFTVNIDTEGKSLSSTLIGMTYETQYLEYVSTSAGNTFTTVSADLQGTGQLVISGSSTTPFSGSGTYAYVTFKLIATGPGSTQLCALYNPSTPTPTSPPVPTTPPGVPTNPPVVPTALPKSGETRSAFQGIILSIFFLITAAGGFLVFKKT